MKITLSPTDRRALRAEAHGLDPVVLVGDQGLTPAVIKEIERSLKAHELIKVRAATDDREEREGWLAEICDALNAAPVQHIGKMLVVWRPKPKEPEKKKVVKKAGAGARARGPVSGVREKVRRRKAT